MAQARGDDKEFFRLTEPGRRMGAGVGSFAERQAFYQRLPQWLGLPWWSKNMSNLVWSVSGAIRQNYAKMLLETGEAKSPLQAGGMAQRRLVDYQYRTPIQNFARHIAPFGTYAGGIPGAVLGGITRDIPRAAALNRMTQGAFYGSKPGPNQPGYESFTPEADQIIQLCTGEIYRVWTGGLRAEPLEYPDRRRIGPCSRCADDQSAPPALGVLW